MVSCLPLPLPLPLLLPTAPPAAAAETHANRVTINHTARIGSDSTENKTSPAQPSRSSRLATAGCSVMSCWVVRRGARRATSRSASHTFIPHPSVSLPEPKRDVSVRSEREAGRCSDGCEDTLSTYQSCFCPQPFRIFSERQPSVSCTTNSSRLCGRVLIYGCRRKCGKVPVHLEYQRRDGKPQYGGILYRTSPSLKSYPSSRAMSGRDSNGSWNVCSFSVSA